MFGVFFEDINFAADGGLYPERVKNRSFEFTEPLTGWREPVPDFGARGELVIRTEGGLNENNPHYLRLRSYTDEGFGLVNSGFRGMGVESGAEYVLSAYVRAQAGGIRALSARLTDERRQPLAEADARAGSPISGSDTRATLRPSGDRSRTPARDYGRGEGRDRHRHGVALSRKTRGRTGPTVCARISCSCSPT